MGTRKKAQTQPPKNDGGPTMIARKLAETDTQIQALRHHTLEQCVAITSSIDTIPAGIVPRAMRERWHHELQQAAHAVTLVGERLAHEPRAES